MAVSKAVIDSYEVVIGLEIHVELKTKTKIFCGCPTVFGAAPNVNSCPICLAMPGTLPVLNEKVVEYAVKAGIVTNCDIAPFSVQKRKHYFYPDLPSAYQVSQGRDAICTKGYVDIETSKGEKRIGITQIHIEEDAGKLVHVEGEGTLVDANRGSVPLIEIVSEPDLRSAEEAKEYLQKIRGLLRYIDVTDAKMNEGSFRCDVNLSVRKKGAEKLGVRAEMKNINSFQSVVRAIEHEYHRHIEAVEAGETLVQETRRFDQETGKTSGMRTKEDSADYRFFPDPNLPPIVITAEFIKQMRETIPVLPDVRKAEYMQKYELSSYIADQITSERNVAEYFDKVARKTKYPVLAANIIVNDIVTKIEDEDFNIGVKGEYVAEIADLLGDERINSGTGRKLSNMLFTDDRSPFEVVKAEGLEQISDVETLTEIAEKIIADNQSLVDTYRGGKTTAMQALVGMMMRDTNGKGNPRLIQKILKDLLDS